MTFPRALVPMIPAEPGRWQVQYDNANGVGPAPVVGFTAVVDDIRDGAIEAYPVVVCCGEVFVLGRSRRHNHGSHTVVPVPEPPTPAWMER